MSEATEPYLKRWQVIIALAALFVAAIVGSIAATYHLTSTIYAHADHAKAPRVVAYGVRNVVEIPSPVQAEYRALSALRKLKKEKLEPISSALGEFAEPLLKSDLTGVLDFNRYYLVVIRNDGRTAAKDIRVSLGHSGYAELVWHDENRSTGEFKHEVKVGTIPHGAEVTVRIWVRGTLENLTSVLADTPVVVYYDGGKANVVFPPYPPNAFQRILVWAPWILVAVFCALLAYALWKARKLLESAWSRTEYLARSSEFTRRLQSLTIDCLVAQRDGNTEKADDLGAEVRRLSAEYLDQHRDTPPEPAQP